MINNGKESLHFVKQSIESVWVLGSTSFSRRIKAFIKEGRLIQT